MSQNVIVRICRWLLALLGFGASVSSCDRVVLGPVMYGSPSMTYSIRGKVVDGSGKPIEGIQVAPDPKTGPFSDERAFTDANGYFLYGPYNDNPIESIDVWFDDVDLEDNGGYFARQKVTFDLHQVKKGRGWDQGTFENDPDFVLTMAPDTREHDWYATMTISGFVYDAVKRYGPDAMVRGGIKVVLENKADSCVVGQDSRFKLEYVVNGKNVPGLVSARFSDCDGAANGSYRDTTINFTMTRSLKGLDYWDLGSWYNDDNVGVYLKKKD